MQNFAPLTHKGFQAKSAIGMLKPRNAVCLSNDHGISVVSHETPLKSDQILKPVAHCSELVRIVMGFHCEESRGLRIQTAVYTWVVGHLSLNLR